jgi:hypothetical protein
MTATESPNVVTICNVGTAPGADEARTTVVVSDLIVPFGARSPT